MLCPQGVNKDSYLILETLPTEYDSRVKAMEVDERPTEQYSDIGGLDKQIQEVWARWGPFTCRDRTSLLALLFSTSVLGRKGRVPGREADVDSLIGPCRARLGLEFRPSTTIGQAIDSLGGKEHSCPLWAGAGKGHSKSEGEGTVVGGLWEPLQCHCAHLGFSPVAGRGHSPAHEPQGEV